MKTIPIVWALICLAWVSGCSTVYDVKYDYDKHIDFQSLKTFDWMPVPDDIDTSPLVMQRVINATEAELGAKGLVKAPSRPDFFIAQHISRQEHIDVVNLY